MLETCAMSGMHLHDYMTARKAAFPVLDGVDLGRYIESHRLTSCRTNLRKFRRGEIIIEAGELTDNFARVQLGLVGATAILPDGREFILEIIPPDGLIGEIDVLQGKPITLEYRAISDCDLFFLDGRWLRETCLTDPKIHEEVFSSALARVSELERRIVAGAGSSLVARVAGTLLRLAAIYKKHMPEKAGELAISQHELAAMVPASREKVNQCLRRLREHNIIGGTQGKIRIINTSALQSYAEGLGAPD